MFGQKVPKKIPGVTDKYLKIEYFLANKTLNRMFLIITFLWQEVLKETKNPIIWLKFEKHVQTSSCCTTAYPIIAF